MSVVSISVASSATFSLVPVCVFSWSSCVKVDFL